MERNPHQAEAAARNEARPGTLRDEKGARASLDACYGRIGIPAVAAALTPRQTERRTTTEPRFTPYDCD
jgi:hypothetical protein